MLQLRCSSQTRGRPPRKRTLVSFLVGITAFVLAFGGSSWAESKFEVTDRGDTVEVLVSDVVAEELAPSVTRERLEIPLRGSPDARPLRPSDLTLRLIEIRGGSRKVLSVKLHARHREVVALAPQVRLQQEGGSLRLVIPRLQAAAPAAAAATPSPAHGQPTASGPAQSPRTSPAADQAASVTTPAAAGAATAVEPIPSANGPSTSAATATAPARAASASSRGLPLTTLIVVGIALAAGAFALIRKRKPRPALTNTLDVLAARNLGGKARVVWLAAGQREMVVAVTGQTIQVLSQWHSAGPPLPARGTGEVPILDERRLSFHQGPSASSGQLSDRQQISVVRASISSPTVTGILRLRERLGQMTAAEREPSGDDEADEQWAKEILAATGGSK